jgi:hypothetical protein
LPVLPGVPAKYQPGAWRKQDAPATKRQNILIDPEYLPPHLRANLNVDRRPSGRQWQSPTGRPAEYGFTDKGPSYFGAWRRDDQGRLSYHGGLDFKGDDVVLPTDARLIDITYDRVLGYTLVFDLGDGARMSLLHVKPSAQLLAAWASGSPRDSGGLSLRMGEPLGTVDRSAYNGTNDHVHLQINLGPGYYRGRPVKGFVVDPMTFFPIAIR